MKKTKKADSDTDIKELVASRTPDEKEEVSLNKNAALSKKDEAEADKDFFKEIKNSAPIKPVKSPAEEKKGGKKKK